MESRADDLVQPGEVVALLQVERAEFVWRNQDGGLTYRLWPGGDYFTWVPPGYRGALRAAGARAAWLRPQVAAPEFGPVRPGLRGWWVVSPALPGQSAVSPDWIGRPAVAVAAIATGLRRLHQIEVAACPFVVDRDELFRSALDRVRRGSDWRRAPDDYLRAVSDERALRLLTAVRGSASDLVVCHGDPCAPNTIVGPEGDFVGLVDLGDLGVLDRLADLAVASWSISWNYGPGWEGLFFQTYGLVPDPDLNDAFRVLWQAADPPRPV
jgi:kanamycin kinase